MKLKKKNVLILLTLMFILMTSMFSMVSARTENKWFGLELLRESGNGYIVNGKNVWEICSYGTGTTPSAVADHSETIYCLRAGIGFGSNNWGNSETEKKLYTSSFDMKQEKIPAEYLSVLPEGETYKKMLWILDNSYVAPKTAQEQNTANEYKNKLLEKAGIPQSENKLTDEDIDAVQQLAIWYFTNPNSEYQVGDSFIFYIKNEDGTFAINQKLGGEYIFENGEARHTQANKLIKYFINNANAQAALSPSINSTVKPLEIEKTNPTVKVENNKYIVGPYKIKQNINCEYTYNVTFTDGNGNEIENYTILDNNNNTLQNIEVNKEFYISVPMSTNVNEVKIKIDFSYFATDIRYWVVTNAIASNQPIAIIDRKKVEANDELAINYTKPQFDLALRKFITKINGVELTGKDSRIPQVDLTPLISGTGTTAIYEHTKNPIIVNTGDKVTYIIRIYNEGKTDGFATMVEDVLPEGLILATNSDINTNNGWEVLKTGDGKTYVGTNKLADQVIRAFNDENLDYKDLEIECEVTMNAGNEKILLKNIAEITDDSNIYQEADRDSEPGNVDIPNYGTINQQDDDDFEQLVIKPIEVKPEFDLSLRKFITSVNGVELKDENNNYLRAPIVDITNLLNGTSKTAIYKHSKAPVAVDLGDVIIYTIRVYNEGEEDGYVTEITDHLPEQLEFIVDDELNASYGWTVSGDGRTVRTDITSLDTQNSASRDTIYQDRKQGNDKVKLDKLTTNGIDYIDVKIKCKVKLNSNIYKKITNIAEISGYVDINGNTTSDRDSTASVVLPTDETLPNYKDDEINNGDEYIPGQEDDDDFEKLVLQRFDLSLRKFITKVNEEEVTERIPVFTRKADGTYTYEHPKTPVSVMTEDLVTYTLRIYNEGNQAGYAKRVKDDIPEGLEFLPENETNTQYRWKMYKEDGELATDVKEAKYIETDYLSKEQEKQEGENLIQAYNPSTMTQPDYKDVKVVFKVKEPSTSDRIIINTAEISDDSDEYGKPVNDVDSEPNNNKPDEDDIDIEKVKVKYFDLALKKWVTSSITIYDGKTTIVKTGHTGDEDPEPVVKVDIKESRLKDIIVKFTYNIKVTNEGEIAGYVKEISDYIPEGLKFIKEDNPNWEEVEGKVVTRQLENTLLQPGESATVEITLTWINDKNNLNLKVNVAEISEDYNESNTPDIDSTPNNQVEGEDDQDDAPVILSLQTGTTGQYIILTMSILAIMATGIALIRKYVI